jgi:hypothetical protein
MAIFNSYVKLPEGTIQYRGDPANSSVIQVSRNGLTTPMAATFISLADILSLFQLFGVELAVLAASFFGGFVWFLLEKQRQKSHG